MARSTENPVMIVHGPLPVSPGRLASPETGTSPDNGSYSDKGQEGGLDLEDARARIEATRIAADIGTWLWDIRADAVRGDSNLNAMFGLSPGAVGPRPIADYLAVIHPDDRAAVWGAISQAIADGNADYYQAQYRLIPDGVERWVHAQGLVKRNAVGVATDLSGVIRDISQQKLLDAQRRQLLAAMDQQARFIHAALSSTEDLIYVFNLDGRVEYVNQSLLNLWGRTLREALGKNLFELGYPEPLASKMHAQIQQVIETGKPITDETSCPISAEAELYCEYVFAPVLASDGSLEGVAGSARDITDHKQSEAALRSRTELFEQVLNHLPMGACVIDPGFRVSFVNAPGRELLDAAPAVVGQDFGKLIRSRWPADRANELLRLCRQTLVSGVPSALPECEWQMQRIDLAQGQPCVVCYFRGDMALSTSRRAAGYAL
jgi:PAS domain S-box-containing protein